MTQKAAPPGPKPRVPGAALLAFRRDPIGFVMDMAKYGDFVHYKLGRSDFYQLNNPEHIKEVLVIKHNLFMKSKGLQAAKRILGDGLLTSEGELHSRQRRLIQPAFFHDRISSYADVMVEYTERQMGKWSDGEKLDIHHEMMKLTLAIVAKTLFGADVQQETEEIRAAVSTSSEYFGRFLNPAAPLLDALPLPSNKRFAEAKSRLDATIREMMEKRRAEETPHDLLSALLHARAEGVPMMTDKLVQDELMTLLLAGHETTANALTWAWYLLSMNPETEKRLGEELDAVLGGRAPTVKDMPSLEYTNAVFTEAMRLYPPAWILGRQALEDCVIGGYPLHRGSILIMSQYVMHHDPRYFDSPKEFRPERWTKEMKAGLPKFAYFPFGGGPRSCVGEPFAWMEGVLLIATIARRWRFVHEDGHAVEMLPRLTLRPKYGMRMTVKAA